MMVLFINTVSFDTLVDLEAVLNLFPNFINHDLAAFIK
jgi:hypothetical protein